MPKGILGRKVGMTQLYDDDGSAVPVTVIEAGPCHILQLRTTDRDGYEAVQLGFRDRPRNRATRSHRGHVAKLSSKRSRTQVAAGVEPTPKAGCEPKHFTQELRGSIEGFDVGQEIKVGDLADVLAVDVVGTSKGRGFAGVRGLPMESRKFIGMPVERVVVLRLPGFSRGAGWLVSTAILV